MRKLIASEMVTVNGYFAGPNGEIDWHTADNEFNGYAHDLLARVDTILYGRVTYEGMASYWPTPAAIQDDPIVAERMNNLSKIVFSKTLDRADWNNSRLVKTDPAQEINKLKQQPGKDMVIFGSGAFVSSLTQQGLIDEYLIIISPSLLSKGIPLFQNIKTPIKLQLIKSETGGSGNVYLTYQRTPSALPVS